jgi:hypothetical protein
MLLSLDTKEAPYSHNLQINTNMITFPWTRYSLTRLVANTVREHEHRMQCRRMATVYLQKSGEQRERQIDAHLDDNNHYLIECLKFGLEQQGCLAEIAYINRRIYGVEHRV